MALTIQGATEGVDAHEVQAALNAIHSAVILDAQNTMRSQMNTLRNEVDNVWVGKSAEVFKDNMEADMNEIIKALDEEYKAIESTFHQVTNNFIEFDENLLQKRGA